MTVREAFALQARACAELGSPFTARLMALFAERLAPGGAVADRIFGWPGEIGGRGAAVPLRLAGALHALARAGRAGLAAVYPPHDPGAAALWRAVAGALDAEAAFILDRLERTPQTNEVNRAGILIPALHLLAARHPLPVALSEIGCSAGLNLRADRFHLRAGAQSYGDPASPVRLAPDWEGPAPAPQRVEVTDRAGADIAPLDPADPADAERLLSYIWPDQPDRLARTAAAIGLAREVPARIDRADAADWLEARLARPMPGRLHVLFHTIAWQYLTPEGQDRGAALVADAGAGATSEAPLARVSMEGDGSGRGARLRLQLWPDDVTLDLGRADFHGRWIAWTGAWPK